MKEHKIFLFPAITFLILKLLTLKFKFSDGYTYMYMGKLILEGQISYKDFFFASPPLQPYIFSFFEIFTKENFLILKLIPILATIGSSFFIYLLMKKKFGEWQGITASVLYLFSFLVLVTTDYSTGIHLTTFFILGMIYFVEEDKPLIAGIFGSLAMLTRLYAPFPILGVLIYVAIYKRNNLPKLILGLASLFIPISLIFEIISKGEYLNQIFFFRLNLISGIGLNKGQILKFFFLKDFFLILSSLTWLIFDKEKKKLFLPLFATLTTAILYIIYSDIYYLYFGLIIGFLSIFSTKLIFNFKNLKNFKRILILIILFLTVLNSAVYITNYSTASNINFSDDLSDYVRENSFRNETIYGSFELTPLIALQSQRKIAGEIADLNPKNILTNEFQIEDIEEKIDGVKFIIGKGVRFSDGRLAGFDASTPTNYINKRCNITKIYPLERDLNGDNVVVVWECA